MRPAASTVASDAAPRPIAPPHGDGETHNALKERLQGQRRRHAHLDTAQRGYSANTTALSPLCCLSTAAPKPPSEPVASSSPNTSSLQRRAHKSIGSNMVEHMGEGRAKRGCYGANWLNGRYPERPYVVHPLDASKGQTPMEEPVASIPPKTGTPLGPRRRAYEYGEHQWRHCEVHRRRARGTTVLLSEDEAQLKARYDGAVDESTWRPRQYHGILI